VSSVFARFEASSGIVRPVQPSSAIVAPAAVQKGVVVAQVAVAADAVAAATVAAVCQVPATGHVNAAGGNFEA